MKVLEIAAGDFFSDYGGGQIYVRNIVDAMIDRGVDVEVVSFGGVDSIQTAAYRGISMYVLPETASEQDLSRVCTLASPDVVHTHSRKAEACRASAAAGIPVVVTAHHGGILCPAGTLLDAADRICTDAANPSRCLRCVLARIPCGRVFRPLLGALGPVRVAGIARVADRLPSLPVLTPALQSYRLIDDTRRRWADVCSLATRVVVPSQRFADILSANGLPLSKIAVVPHGVAVPQVARTAHPTCTRICYVGRINRVKGLHVLIEAFMSLPQPGMSLHIIGDAATKYERRYRARLRRLTRHDKRIVWHGKLPPAGVAAALAGMSVGCAPSIFLEAFGLGVAEMLACGLPVIATRSGGPEMQICHGKNGWLVPPGDVDALRRTILHAHETIRRGVAQPPPQPVKSLDDHISELLTLFANVYEDRIDRR